MLVLFIFVLYVPPIIYTTVVSIRFYGAKNWLNGVLGNPAYFILPVTTCLSFYEKTNSRQNETNRNTHYENHGLDHWESLGEIGVKQADETQSSTNSHNERKSTEDQVVNTTERFEVSIISVKQENDSEHSVVNFCDVKEKKVNSNTKAKNPTVSESHIVSSSVEEENETNASTSTEMTFSVSQSNMIYGYYMCLLTLILLLMILGSESDSDRKLLKLP